MPPKSTATKRRANVAKSAASKSAASKSTVTKSTAPKSTAPKSAVTQRVAASKKATKRKAENSIGQSSEAWPSKRAALALVQTSSDVQAELADPNGESVIRILKVMDENLRRLFARTSYISSQVGDVAKKCDEMNASITDVEWTLDNMNLESGERTMDDIETTLESVPRNEDVAQISAQLDIMKMRLVVMDNEIQKMSARNRCPTCDYSEDEYI